jgi:deoxyribodipyrimidine photo-lyase
MWFRRDLRIHDNLALAQALDQHELVVPVYCLDNRLLEGRNRGADRAAFLGACLKELEDKLEELGSGLVILADQPEHALAKLSHEVGASEVFAAADVSPFARRRDHGVAASLMQHDASLRLWPGAFATDDLGSIRTGAGGPYSVFTPFHRRWLSEPRRRVEPAPARLPKLPKLSAKSGTEQLAGAGQLGGAEQLPERSRWTPGEAAAHERLESFLADTVSDYTDGHDALGRSGTSELSPYLHFGCISPRQIESRLPQNAGADALRRQLCWRDFYAHVLLHNPGNAHAEHQPRLRRKIKWKRSEKLFRAWTDGQTGYPLVDAGMRELATTGWMHNRARMVVGSFLVKDLGIDWRWGERWFMRKLLDGDQANNNGNWQWIASVGVDTQPPSRRILNPTLQQQRFDPDGTYVRRYVGELSPVPDEHLAEPWKMPDELQRDVGCVIGVDYPQPIIDHAQARLEALERYAAANETSEQAHDLVDSA